jgi:hypothetical protein
VDSSIDETIAARLLVHLARAALTHHELLRQRGATGALADHLRREEELLLDPILAQHDAGALRFGSLKHLASVLRELHAEPRDVHAELVSALAPFI